MEIIVERIITFTVSVQIDGKPAATVTTATIALPEPCCDALLTITVDNGKEFVYHEQVTKSLDTEVSLSAPYTSWQRSQNENTKIYCVNTGQRRRTSRR